MSSISIGVDIGSTSIKAVALDCETRHVIRVVSALLDSRIVDSPSGHYEEDPRRIRELTLGLIRQLAKEFKERIVAIAFTGQMHSGMYVDESLEPITNLVTWQDKRGDEISSEGITFAEKIRAAAGNDPTGVGIHTGFIAVSASWFAEKGFVVPPGAKLLGIYDWLTSLLIGRRVTDITSAAAWGLLDIVSKSWNTPVLTAAGIPESALPRVMEPGAFIAWIDSAVATDLGLPAEIRVHASIGDTQASYIGSGAKADEILLNFGTGSQSMWQTDRPIATPGTDIRYLHSGHYLVTAPTLAGGKAYEILADFYASVLLAFQNELPDRAAIYERLNQLALDAKSDGVRFDPIFAGNRWRESSERGSIAGLDTSNFRIGCVTRALLEGMIDEVAAPYFEREGKVNHQGLVGAGNGMRRNPALRDVAEKRFGVTLRLAESEEEAARGAAILALPTSELPSATL